MQNTSKVRSCEHFRTFAPTPPFRFSAPKRAPPPPPLHTPRPISVFRHPNVRPRSICAALLVDIRRKPGPPPTHKRGRAQNTDCNAKSEAFHVGSLVGRYPGIPVCRNVAKFELGMHTKRFIDPVYRGQTRAALHVVMSKQCCQKRFVWS